MILHGKGAVVTGGGRGIGEAIARQLAAEGAAVMVAARSAVEVGKVAEDLREAGHRAWSLPCDVTDPAQVAELARVARQEIGRIDILVNNAGAASSAPLAGITLEEWNRLFAVNATSTFLCARAFLPGMVEGGWGRVVNVASIAGRTGAPYIAAYSAAKHAVLGFTRSLAAEVAAKGVTVNAVCPGYVDTRMTEESLARIVSKTGLAPDRARATLEGLSPQGRLFEPEEVAYLVLALCDPRARGINGQAIGLDGGALLV